MVLIRFMSIEEMDKYLAGEVLRNDFPWKTLNKSTSRGFCFFPEEPAPEERLHYISGVVSFDVVGAFETMGPIMLKKGTGKYRDPVQDNPKSLADALYIRPKMMDVDEYSLTEYSNKVLRLVRMGTVVFGRDYDWHLIWGKKS